MRIIVTVVTDELCPGSTDTSVNVTNTRDVAVGGPHEWEGAITRVAGELARLSADQLLLAAKIDAARRR